MEVADSRERTGSRTSRLEAGRPALPAGPDRATLVRRGAAFSHPKDGKEFFGWPWLQWPWVAAFGRCTS